MHVARPGDWDVRPMFEFSGKISQTDLDRLADALRSGPPILGAEPVIEDRGTGFSVGAHLTIRAQDPPDALRLALEAFGRAAAVAGIATGALREATVSDASKDLRA
jgi:hypothetical protein